MIILFQLKFLLIYFNVNQPFIWLFKVLKDHTFSISSVSSNLICQNLTSNYITFRGLTKE